jgi:hypothetical protein
MSLLSLGAGAVSTLAASTLPIDQRPQQQQAGHSSLSPAQFPGMLNAASKLLPDAAEAAAGAA